MASDIRINGNPTPVENIKIGDTVTLSNADNTGVTTWQWALLAKPAGSTAALTTPTSSTSTFVADMEGSWLVKLTTNGSVDDTAVARVLTTHTGAQLMARGEVEEGDSSGVEGWAKPMRTTFQAIDKRIGLTSRKTVKYVGSNTTGPKLLKLTGSAILSNGDVVPTADQAAIGTGYGALMYFDSSSALNTNDIISPVEQGFTNAVSNPDSLVAEDKVYMSSTAGALTKTQASSNAILVAYCVEVSGPNVRMWFDPGQSVSGGGTLTGAGSSGAVAFWAGATSLTEDPTQLFWDNTNNRLGIGTASPNVALDVVGTIATTVSSGNNAASYSNGVDSTLTIVPVGSGQMRLRTDFSGRWISFAPGGGSTDMLSVKEAGVGIGTTSQTYTLEVKNGTAGVAINATSQEIGTTWGSGGAFSIFAESPGSGTGPKIIVGGSARGDALKNATTFNVSGSEYMRIDGDFAGHTLGNIGVGTTTPTEKLHVSGNVRFSGALMPSGSAGTSGQVLTSAGSGSPPTWTTPSSGLGGSGSSGALAFWTGASTLGEDSTQLFWDNTNNRLGVGTASPANQLHIYGSTDGLLHVDSQDSSGNNSGITVNNAGAGTGHAFIKFMMAGTEVAAVAGNDTEGFGMVDGLSLRASSGREIGFRIANTSVGRFKTNGDFLVDTDTLYVDATNNRVGIGTATPSTATHIKAGSNAADGSRTNVLTLHGSSYGSGAETQVLFRGGQDATNGAGIGAGIAAVDVGSYDLRLDFRTRNNLSYDASELTTSHTRMCIDSDGKIGIGTTSPSHVLSVQQSVASASIVKFQNTSTSGLSASTFYDSGGTARGGVGSGNSAATSPYINNVYLQSINGSNLIFLTGTGATPTERMRIDTSGNITVDTNTLYVDATNNRVGIGTASPSSQFHIQGTNSMTWDGNTLTVDNINTTRSVANVVIKSTASDDPLPNIAYLHGSTVLGSIEGWNESDQYGMVRGLNLSIHSPSHVLGIRSVDGITTTQRAGFKHNGDFYVDPASNTFYVDATNNRVGVGTATPAVAVDVVGCIGTTVTSGSVGWSISNGVDSTMQVVPVGSGQMRIRTDFAGRWMSFAPEGGSTDVMAVRGTGVHIGGTSSPSSTLQVTGTIGASGTVTGSNLSGTNTGDVTLASFGSTPNANGASLSGQQVTLQPADASNPGGVSTSAQTFAGAKTFSAQVSATLGVSSAAPNVYDGETSITAYAGGGQTNATALTAEINFATTVATTGDSVKLPTATLGSRIVVFNDGANSMDIFPASGNQIDSLGANNAYSLTAGSSREFFGKSSTDWRSR